MRIRNIAGNYAGLPDQDTFTDPMWDINCTKCDELVGNHWDKDNMPNYCANCQGPTCENCGGPYWAFEGSSIWFCHDCAKRHNAPKVFEEAMSGFDAFTLDNDPDKQMPDDWHWQEGAGTFIYLDGKLYHIYNTPGIGVTHAKMMSKEYYPEIRQQMLDKFGEKDPYTDPQTLDVWALRNALEKEGGFTGRVSPGKEAAAFWNTERQIQQRYDDFLECLKALAREDFITGNTEIHIPSMPIIQASEFFERQVTSTAAAATTTEPEPATQQDIERLRQLHTMPAAEKKKAMQDMGYRSRGPKYRTNPGQKWWAPYSESYDNLPDEDVFADNAVCSGCGDVLEDHIEVKETDDRAALAWYIKYSGDAYALGPLRFQDWTTADVASEEAMERFGYYPAELWPDGRVQEDLDTYEYSVQWSPEEFICFQCDEQLCPKCVQTHACGLNESYEGLPDEDEFEDSVVCSRCQKLMEDNFGLARSCADCGTTYCVECLRRLIGRIPDDGVVRGFEFEARTMSGDPEDYGYVTAGILVRCPECTSDLVESYEGLPDEDQFVDNEWGMPHELVEFVDFLNENHITPYVKNSGGIGLSDGEDDVLAKIEQNPSFSYIRKMPHGSTLGRYQIGTPWITPTDDFDEEGTPWVIGYYGETYSYGHYDPPWEAHQ